MGQNDEFKIFVEDVLCTWCHRKGKAEILCDRIAGADPCINPYDCTDFMIFFLLI